MTDAEIATQTIAVTDLETTARTYWDALADGQNGSEYVAAQAVVRQAGALRRSLENWIVARATQAQRAASAR